MSIMTIRRPLHRSHRSGLARAATLCLTAVVGMTLAAPGESSAQADLLARFVLRTGAPVGLNGRCEAQPTPIIPDAVAVSVGRLFALALRSDGTVIAWGDNEDAVDGAQPYVCAEAFLVSDSQAAAHCPSVCEAQGFVFNGSWANDDPSVNDAGCVGGQEAICRCQPSNVVAISAGVNDGLALLENGTVFRWGECPSNSCIGYTPMPAGLSGVVAMDNAYNSIVLKSDGTIVTWGGGINRFHTSDCFPKPRWPGSLCHSPPPGLSGVVDVAANAYHFAAVKSDGTVVVWGRGNKSTPSGIRSPEVPPELNHDIVKVRLSDTYNMALRSDGTVFNWNTAGLPTTPPPADLDDAVDIGFYGFSGGMALKGDGRVVRWGPPVSNVCSSVYPHVIDRVICAGELYSRNVEAQARCPSVCAFHLLVFDGTWTNEQANVSAAGCDAGQESVCGCTIGNVTAMATDRTDFWGPSAFFIIARDRDGDGVSDDRDAFPDDPTESVDSDGDGVGDNRDAFPNDPTESAETDGDGVGDNRDAFPNDPTESADTDGDGVGDNGDAFPNDPTEWSDIDGDGVGDNRDAFPNDPTESVDTDGDGVGDNGDNCPGTPNPEQADLDGDASGDVCDDEDAQLVLDRATVWRMRSKLGRMILEGRIPSGVYGATDLFSTDAGFSVRVKDALTLNETVVFAPEDCATPFPRVKRCRLPDRTSWVEFSPIEGTDADLSFKANLRRLDIDRPQLGPVHVTIRHGEIDRVGVNASCRLYESKMDCSD